MKPIINCNCYCAEIQKDVERLVNSGISVVIASLAPHTLILSKIVVVDDIKHLEFNRIHGDGQVIFDKFPDKINYFGEIFIKRFWPHNRPVIIYTEALGETVKNQNKDTMLITLVISKIETLPNDTKRMECNMTGTNILDEFCNYPPSIIFLGDHYTKTDWNFERKIIYYQTR